MFPWSSPWSTSSRCRGRLWSVRWIYVKQPWCHSHRSTSVPWSLNEIYATNMSDLKRHYVPKEMVIHREFSIHKKHITVYVYILEIYVDICMHVIIHVMQFIWGPKISDVDMCFPIISMPIEVFDSNPRNCFFPSVSSCCSDSLFSECHCVILGFLLPNIITSRCFKPKEIGITFISMLFTNSFRHL